jgi:hypothetical protein
MPRGPKGQKRPADVIRNAVKVMRIATGEEAEDLSADDGEDKTAHSQGCGTEAVGENKDLISMV